ncbi:PEGA domain-containing protein [Candidatus Saganbacteria bacterium]|uniref:PEGA domain-containing protein n=1 Tax=Candidatus Saganbacteria bacterium TaxID=2575572 RepID=A0A9D6UKG8_UNCSA|nr:PEGA domain-containing protein [Candidatus Saganbacteria bacterium]
MAGEKRRTQRFTAGQTAGKIKGKAMNSGYFWAVRTMKNILSLILIVMFLPAMALAQEEYGQLKIISKYGEYRILLDGENVGTTPLVLKNIQSGPHLLRVVDKKTYLTIAEKTMLKGNIYVKGGKLNTIIIEEEIKKHPVEKKEEESEKKTEEQPKTEMLKNEAFFSIESSNYAYKEPGVMEDTGRMYGITYSNVHYSSQYMLKIKYEGRYFWGLVNYAGRTSGGTPVAINDISDWGYELRLMWGNDYLLSEAFYLTPYMGGGYRYLNDNSQLKDPRGYQRESKYFYIPMGIEVSRSFNNRFFTAMLEFDYFFGGAQFSRLSDVSHQYSDVTSDQGSGYGLRCSIGYSQKLGNINYEGKLFLRLWSINESDTDANGYYEPANNTTETGFAIGVHF